MDSQGLQKVSVAKSKARIQAEKRLNSPRSVTSSLKSASSPEKSKESPRGVHILYQLYLGVADGVSMARVWARRYSK